MSPIAALAVILVPGCAATLVGFYGLIWIGNRLGWWR